MLELVKIQRKKQSKSFVVVVVFGLVVVCFLIWKDNNSNGILIDFVLV